MNLTPPAETEVTRQVLVEQITEFADHTKRDTIIERSHPVVRLLAPVLAMTGVLISGNMYVFYGFAVFVGVIAPGLGVGKAFWARFILVGLTISLFTFVIRGFFDYGQSAIFNIGPFSYTHEGLSSALWYTAMLLAVCAPIILAICILTIEDGVAALSALGAPQEAAYITMNAVRMIPELGEVSRSVKDAQRSRGIQVDGGRLVQLRALVPSIVPLVLSALSGVEERAIAMEVRGFGASKERTALRSPQRMTPVDFAAIGLVLILSCASAFLGRVL